MKHVGFFVVGEGKFGEYAYGDQFIKANESLHYWKNRGYQVVPVFAPEGDETVTYAHMNDTTGCRFRQYGQDPLPVWAVDVKLEA